MTIYRACLLSPAGKLAAVHRVSADDDDMAVAIVRDTGRRRIEPSKKKPQR